MSYLLLSDAGVAEAVRRRQELVAGLEEQRAAAAESGLCQWRALLGGFIARRVRRRKKSRMARFRSTFVPQVVLLTALAVVAASTGSADATSPTRAAAAAVAVRHRLA